MYRIIGTASDINTYFCEHVLQLIGNIDVSVTFTLETFIEREFIKKTRELAQKYGGAFHTHQANHLVVMDDGEYVGGVSELMKVAKDQYGIEGMTFDDITDLKKRAEIETKRLLSGTNVVYMEFMDGIDEGESRIEYGRVVIELFSHICPAACENFRRLCVGEGIVRKNKDFALHYEGSQLHRIVPGGWLQGGDIIDGSGNNSVPATQEGAPVQDESFGVDFDDAIGGIVGYSTSSPHSIGSQFFVTFGPCPWMQFKFVGIGRVIEGFKVLKAIESIETSNQKPLRSIIISKSGLLFG